LEGIGVVWQKLRFILLLAGKASFENCYTQGSASK